MPPTSSQDPRARTLGILALTLTVVIWGSTFVVTKAALHSLGPFTLAVARFLLASAILLPFALRQGFRLRDALQPAFLKFGLTGVALYYGFQNLGLAFTSAGTAALIQTLVPAATVALSVWLLKERVTAVQVLGIGLAVIGAALASGTGAPSAANPAPLLGNLFILGGVFAWAVYTIQGKRLSASYPSVVLAAGSILSGMLILLPFAAGELLLSGLPSVPGPALLALLYLGTVASAVPMFLWNAGLSLVPASVASPFINIVPVVGVAFAVLAGERPTALQILGGAVALAGVWMCAGGGRRLD